MTYSAASKNDPLGGDYTNILAPYVINVAEPTMVPAPEDVSCKIYSASGSTPTAFLLWIATPGVPSKV